MTRLSRVPMLGLAMASTLVAGVAAAQAPPAGIPAAGTTPPPPAAPPPVAGAATAIQGVTPVYADKPDFKAPRKPTAWDPHLSAGGTLAFADNESVAGQVSGFSLSLGLKIDGGLNYNNGNHEWRNNLGLGASVTRTPVIPEFVKTSDYLNLETIYLYHVVDTFGPYVRGQMLTSMFPGRDVRPGVVGYQYMGANGKVDTTKLPSPNIEDCSPTSTVKIPGNSAMPNGSTITVFPSSCRTSISLSDGFRPLTFKESVGLFWQPYQSDPATIELRAGLGAQEVLAAGQLSAAPDATTPSIIDLTELTNSNQLGAEVALGFWGAVVEKRINYKLDADAMVPFVHSALAAGSTLTSPLQLMNLQFDAMLSFKIVDWASLDYQLKVLRQPQVLDAFQVQNSLLLTFGLNYPAKAPPPPLPCVPVPQPSGSAPAGLSAPAPGPGPATPPPPASP